MHTRTVEPEFIVTGGAGFIGANLIAALNARGHEAIRVVDRLDDANRPNLTGLRFRQFLDKDDFRQAMRADRLEPVATVFHLGACSSTTETDEGYLRDNNFAYTRELCEWCLARGIRFVYASSAATYGDGALGYSDHHALVPELRPLNPYGRSKQMFDLWALNGGVLDRIAGLKYFNVYGPGEDHKGDMRSVVNKAFGQIRADGEVRLFRSHRPDYLDGAQRRDFVFVRDAVRASLFFHDQPRACGLFNVGTGRARTWLDLARAVFAAMGREPRIAFVDMPAAIREQYQYHSQADIGKLRAAGYAAPFTDIEAGVEEYVRQLQESPKPERFS